MVEEHEMLEDNTSEISKELEGDLMEDEVLVQQVEEEEKAAMPKGVRKNQKVRAQDVNPKSTRPSRRKH